VKKVSILEAITLGLIAALAWGIHDVLLRYISQQTSIYSAMLVVLISGTFFQFVYLTSNSGPLLIEARAIPTTLGSGVAFLVASVGLYKAFEIGPVRLVAPIVASYPVVTLTIAAMGGKPITVFQCLAVLTIISGVSAVAYFSRQINSDLAENAQQSRQKANAIIWAIISALGFSGSFAFGHAATSFDLELSITFTSRVIAIVLLILLMLILKKRFQTRIRQMPFLLLMGLMDSLAHASVISAGRLENAEYSAVVASTFGMVTILLAWIFLKESMNKLQWLGVLVAFSGIGYLTVN
jgi:drug/metabolite transporter (DMT)-like permease